MKKADIGMVGLAVMGSNLALNMGSHGFDVAVWNYTPDLTEAFISGAAHGKERITAYYDLKEFVAGLKKPRRVFLMIRAGAPVDSMIEQLIPLLDEGDIIIDGGNSHFNDTARRTALAESHGLLYVGTGVSGGEEGALHGPSMMPGGSYAAWEYVKPIFQSICAHVDGVPCCDWVGENGAGHFVKMVHNGIEYGDMQLICEAYQLMRDAMGASSEEMGKIFRAWNETELKSYLIEITGDILSFRDSNGEVTVEHILDRAGQKGTGKWTGIAALDEGVPLTLITEAVMARCLSAAKSERVRAAGIYRREISAFSGDRVSFIEDVRRALYAAKIVSYSQGYSLMNSAAKTYGWNLNRGGIAMTWRGGCIIRSAFLGKIKEAFDRDPGLDSLLTDPYFSSVIKENLASLRRVVAYAVTVGIPMPAFSSALSYFDGYTCAELPANLLQAQRDYFGAHTYERADAPAGVFFHTDWTGHGGKTSSTSYNV